MSSVCIVEIYPYLYYKHFSQAVSRLLTFTVFCLENVLYFHIIIFFSFIASETALLVTAVVLKMGPQIL